MRSVDRGHGAAPHLRTLSSVVALAVFAACAGQTGPPAPDADPVRPEPEDELTTEDFYGTYDLYMGGAGHETGGEAAPLTAEWGPDEFVVSQDGNPMIRTDISIDPGAGEIRLWDATTSDLLCSSEGVYGYEDDGTTITLELESDPCTGRAESADGARLVRR